MVSVPRPRIVSRSTDLDAEDLPEQVTVALHELAGAAKEGLLALSVGVGLAVVRELFEAEVTRLAGAKGKHDPNRRAYRHGQESRQVTLGGRRVHVDKPRCWPGYRRAATQPAWSQSARWSRWPLQSQPSRGLFKAPSRSWPSCSGVISANWTCWRSSSMGSRSPSTVSWSPWGWPRRGAQ